MVNVVYNQLKDNIREREKVDKPLINWFLLTFILSWLTFGIAFVYVFIKRILRVDKYIRRKHEFFDMVIHFIELESNERGLDKYEEYMSSLRGRLSRFQKEVHPVMPFVIKGFLPVIIFTLSALRGNFGSYYGERNALPPAAEKQSCGCTATVLARKRAGKRGGTLSSERRNGEF